MSVEAPVKLRDVYQDITDVVIAQLEAGVVPWRKTWVQGSNDSYLPQNAVSKKSYRGWNVFWLNMFTEMNGFSSNRYITFKQALECKGMVRKGSKGTQITYWLQLMRKPEDGVEGGEVVPGKKFMVPKIYTVFNIDQCDGLNFEILEVLERTEHERIAMAEDIVANMPNKPTILNSGNQPCYIPARDMVMVPGIADFDNAEHYYATMFHELAHSTGAAHRLNRKEIVDTERSKTGYAYEELVAELTASFLNGIIGSHPKTLDLTAAYLASWLKHLKDDKKLILTAAARAQKAADYILDIKESDRDPVMAPSKVEVVDKPETGLIIIPEPEFIYINPEREELVMIPPSKVTGNNCFHVKEKMLKAVGGKFKAGKNLPILECVMVYQNSAWFTDLHHTVEIRHVGVHNCDKFCINKHDLYTGLQQCPTPVIRANSMEIIFSQEDTHISFTAINAEDFPRMNTEQVFVEEGFTTEKFMKQLNTAYKFLSKDEQRPSMMNVNVAGYVMGTDAHKAYFEKNDALFYTDMLFTKKTVELLRLSSRCYKVERSDTHLKFTNDDLRIYQEIVDERYPDLMSVIPQAGTVHVEVNTSMLIDKLKVAVKTANKISRIVKLTFKVNGLVISTKDEDNGKSFVTVLSHRNYNENIDTVICFNGEFLLQILGSCQEWVSVTLNGLNRGAIFDGKLLLMPTMMTD